MQTDMTQIEQIKAEIKRLYDMNYNGLNSDQLYWYGRMGEDLDTFLTTLEAEEEENNAPKIQGWVARDKDGSVRLFEKKPEWIRNRWEGHHFYLGGEKFGIDVKRAEPVEVELLIRKV